MIEGEGYNILDSQVTRNNGHYERTTWLKGHYPDIGGRLVDGITGPETVVNKVVIKPIVVFEVRDKRK